MEPQDRSTHNARTRRTGPSKAELSLAGRIFGLQSWINTDDRSERTRPAREAMIQKFLDLTKTPECPEGDPVKAEVLRRKFYAEIALKSAQVRRRNRAARKNATD